MFFPPEDAFPRTMAFTDVPRIRAKKLRRGRTQFAIDNRPTVRNMVAFIAPRPCARCRRLAKNHEKVELSVSDISTFTLVEDLLKLSDALRFVIAFSTETRLYKCECGFTLSSRHCFERDPFPFAGNEVPV